MKKLNENEMKIKNNLFFIKNRFYELYNAIQICIVNYTVFYKKESLYPKNHFIKKLKHHAESDYLKKDCDFYCDEKKGCFYKDSKKGYLDCFCYIYYIYNISQNREVILKTAEFLSKIKHIENYYNIFKNLHFEFYFFNPYSTRKILNKLLDKSKKYNEIDITFLSYLNKEHQKYLEKCKEEGSDFISITDLLSSVAFTNPNYNILPPDQMRHLMDKTHNYVKHIS